MTRLIYTVEVFDCAPGITVGFFNIATTEPEELDRLARQLCTAIGPESGGYDFAMIHVREEEPAPVLKAVGA
ncbi:hypothetical protein [Streptomyces noursei]